MSEPKPGPVETADCRVSEPLPSGEGIELVLEGVARAQTNDLRCGPPNEAVRICRALFLVATLDPAQHLDDPPQFQRANDALEWALNDSMSIAPPDLAPALQALLAATERLKAATGDNDRAEALFARSDPAVTQPLDAHWEMNCG